MFRIYIILILGCAFGQFVIQKLQAQQLPLYSQYTFNAFLQNPAVAGAEGYDAINLTTREQWIGVEGAPRTYALSYQTRLLKRNYIEKNASVKKRHVRPLRSGRVGLGMYVYNDHAGQIDQTGAQFTYAYHIITGQSQLSIGATFSLLQYMINTSNLKLSDQTDSHINNDRLLVYTPDVNLGLYYADPNKFIGFSVLQLSNAALDISNYNNDRFRIDRHFYLTGGYKYELNEFSMIEPSMYVKSSDQLRLQIDVTLKYIYNRKFWLGLGYRTRSTFIGSIGVNINRFYAGYAYDYSPNGLLDHSYGSHELMVAVKFGDNVRRYKWIERY